jgi:hypothetical protein
VTRPTAPFSYRAVHLLALWSLVVAQPVYDVLRENGEFFVAHRASPLDLVLFAAVVSVVLPAMLAVGVRGVSAISATAGRALHLLLVGALAAAIASQVLGRLSSVGLAAHVTVAAATAVLSAWTYERAAPARLAVSVLGLAVPVSAAVFLLHPEMTPFVRPTDPTRGAAAEVPAGAPPIVVVVFDQLPVSSLMRPDGAIDAERYPGFAALAGTATWFRNATSNSELTGWAVPSLLAGTLPRRGRLPIAAHHPQNLFTVLGGTYRMQVTEPITQLCPQRLCGTQGEPRVERLTSMVLDAMVVYLHVVAPRDLRGRLPALTNDWRDFAGTQDWLRRWALARDTDRGDPPARFIDSIRTSDVQPTLYYLHVLLPHEPYIYMRTGQQVTREAGLPGLGRFDRWTSHEWPVLQAYQRHLLQVEYADTLVERLVRRLTSEGLFDRSLVVITADHGVSFRPGRPFKGLERITAPDIVSVPLFVKLPGQREGRIDDRNMQAIDVLPSLASALHVQLRSPVEGTAAVEGSSAPAVKVIRHSGATREMQFPADELARARMASVVRRWSLFDGTASPVPPGAPRRLLGQPAPADAGSQGPGAMQALIRDPELLRSVDFSAPMLPLRIEGRLLDGDGRPGSSTLAVAVNGTIRAVTRTLDGLMPGRWSAQLEPGALRERANDVQVFLVSSDGARLQLAYPVGLRPPSLDLASGTATEFWSVRQTGLSPREDAPVPFRWIARDASIIVPLEAAQRPRSVRIGLAGPPPSDAQLRIEVNGCALYEGVAGSAPWYRTFSLDTCPGLATAAEARIVIRTIGGKPDRRPGVALETLNLFPEPWPPPSPGPYDLRAAVRVVGGAPEKVARADPLVLEVRNRGLIAWADPTSAADGSGSAALELRWRHGPSGREDRTQRLRLPRVLHPADQVRVEVPLVPPAGVEGGGPWEVAIVPVTGSGVEIPLERPCAIRVREA